MDPEAAGGGRFGRKKKDVFRAQRNQRLGRLSQALLWFFGVNNPAGKLRDSGTAVERKPVLAVTKGNPKSTALSKDYRQLRKKKGLPAWNC